MWSSLHFSASFLHFYDAAPVIWLFICFAARLVIQKSCNRRDMLSFLLKLHHVTLLTLLLSFLCFENVIRYFDQRYITTNLMLITRMLYDVQTFHRNFTLEIS